ncbi:ABC transporter permease [Aliarcobacter butzleri]|uniref:ABC transporter permease n=1 Tax=Aliarcobacter butzleri TaxID=28197 RepID=UPI0021B2CC7C|nr:ABC transporter permease [Aliarcobacter butzleri]MCT7551341.1 ABC transporter permease [Aliarcobacter butzleri]
MFFSKGIFTILSDLWHSKRLLLDLAKNDFKMRYLGNTLGILWAFLQPTAMILLFWFVFSVGFKSQPMEGVPFILWLLAGLVPWFFFSESLQSATTSILDNSFLVKKVVFRVALLPIVKLMSALAIHIFFILFTLGIFIYYGYYPSIYWLQIGYYLFATVVLVLGLSWITSSVVIFFRDLGQIVTMILQFGFWITPVIWSISIMPKEYIELIQFNPAYYLVQGYRESLIEQRWFWENDLTLYFWIVTLFILSIGAFIFKKLRPHFADVL